MGKQRVKKTKPERFDIVNPDESFLAVNVSRADAEKTVKELSGVYGDQFFKIVPNRSE